jgi:Zn-dependent peptidase ImmA (M78 family)
MLPEIAPEEFAGCLDELVTEVLDEAGVTAPPVDAFEVARSLGLVIATDDRQSGRARFVRLSGYRRGSSHGSILLKPDPRTERQQWAVAHEIGEHLSQRLFAALGVEPWEAPEGAREQTANHLAGRLLLPSRWFAEAGKRLEWELPGLKQQFCTASHELIARRMLELPPPIIVSVIDQGRVTWRRSNVPGSVPVATLLEEECRQQAHLLGEPQWGTEGPNFIQVWPVHEASWKREIVRVTLGEEW